MIGIGLRAAGPADIIQQGGDRSRLLLKRCHCLPFWLKFAFLAILGAACGSGGGDAKATPGSQATPPDAAAIRQVDFNQNADVQRLLSQVGSGRIEPGTILYADLTADSREEAIIPVSSGGTLGNVAYLVFTRGGNGPTLLLTRTLDRSSAGGLQMAVEDGRLVETAAEYGPEDPLCCPSVLRRTLFRWDGAKLQVEREEKLPTTPGPKR